MHTLLKKYLEENGRFLRPTTIDITEKGFEHLTHAVGDILITKLEPRHIKQWQCWFIDSRMSKVTANIYVKTIMPVFSWAVREGLLENNPFKGVRLFKVPKQRIKVYEDWEIAAMLEACPDVRWKGLIVLARTSGLRRGECLNLRISDIDFNAKLVYVSATKESFNTWPWQPKDYEIRTLPLADAAAQLLAERIEELRAGQPYLFLTAKRYETLLKKHLNGGLSHRQQQTPSEHFTVPFNKIRKRAGVKVGTFHDLRRTWVTRLLRSGLPAHEVKELAGHSDIKTTMTFYAGSCPDTLERARRAINADFTESNPQSCALPNCATPRNRGFTMVQV